jgi:hypothetical protein
MSYFLMILMFLTAFPLKASSKDDGKPAPTPHGIIKVAIEAAPSTPLDPKPIWHWYGTFVLENGAVVKHTLCHTKIFHWPTLGTLKTTHNISVIDEENALFLNHRQHKHLFISMLERSGLYNKK